jgi:hypothetical protein
LLLEGFGLAGGLFPLFPPEGFPVVLGALAGLDDLAISISFSYCNLKKKVGFAQILEIRPRVELR